MGGEKMNQKGKIVLIFILSMTFILGLTVQGESQEDIEFVINSFKKTNAALDQYWLHVGIPYGIYQDDHQWLDLGNQLSKALELAEQNQLQTIGLQKFYRSQGTWGKETEVELQLKRQNAQTKEMYLIFQLKGNQSLEEMSMYYQKLYQTLQENQISPKINSCIQGSIDDKLNNGTQLVLIDQILHNLKAKKVEQLDTDLVKSVSAFSTLIKQSIWTGNQKMNIQVATHLDVLKQRTVLTVGTPIIIVEY